MTASAAEKMDVIYRRQRFIYDATRRYYLFGRDRLIEDLEPPANGTVLEIGCGTARNLIRAARLYPEARFYGLDVSEAMLRSARASVARCGLAARIFSATETPPLSIRSNSLLSTTLTVSSFPTPCP